METSYVLALITHNLNFRVKNNKWKHHTITTILTVLDLTESTQFWERKSPENWGKNIIEQHSINK